MSKEVKTCNNYNANRLFLFNSGYVLSIFDYHKDKYYRKHVKSSKLPEDITEDSKEFKDLAELKDRDVLYIDENGITKYAIMPIDAYDKADEILSLYEESKNMNANVKVIGADNEDITYEEYERIKALIMEAVEKTFKPKAEKLN